MLNIDEQDPQCASPSGNAGGQEEEPEQACSSACSKYRNAIIVTSYIILGTIIVILAIIIVILATRLASSTMENQKIQAVQTGHVGVYICPYDWIGYQGHCYKLIKEDKTWLESQNSCILHNASLAKITEEKMVIMKMLTRDHVFWIGLRRDTGQTWKWPDGENATMKIMGNGGDCALLDKDVAAMSMRCSSKHYYLCQKNHYS
ncbi:early activation antigen CD69-like isoform X2 [Ahaetulla prasina]|nr:early activation antigen CD69-like isoform X2 [Ahaetulla prasina]